MSKSVAIIGSRGYPSYYGGFETLVRHLAPYLADHGWDVTVYARPDTTRGDDADPRITVVETTAMDSKSLSTLSHGYFAARHAVQAKPDVAIVLNVANGYFLPMLRRAGIPTVVNVDGVEWKRAKWGTLARKVFRGGARLTAKYADHLIYDSQHISALWREEFHREGHFIPYGGMDPGRLDPVSIFGGLSYALMVARLVPENSVEEFLGAAEILAPEFAVAVVGSSGLDSRYDDRMRAMSERHENFHWFGHMIDDAKLNALWQHAGAYFHGHSAGGTNPALVQAMVCGAPIVARDTVFNREVLADTGLFTTPEPSSIADSVASLLTNDILRAELSSAARDRSRLHYTWESVCGEYDRLLAAALEEGPGSLRSSRPTPQLTTTGTEDRQRS